MKKYFIFLLLFLPICHAKHIYLEKEYQEVWCNKKGGQIEYVLNDKTRVDCLLPDMAVEFDFAPKWAECIGQAIYYGKKTKRIPACVLIIENPEKEAKYLYKLRYAIYKKKKIQNIKTYTMTPNMLRNRNIK